MKKVILVLGMITMGLSSCNKEELCASSNCGVIVNDGIDLSTDCYWLEIQNECSGNNKVFCFDQNTWMTNYVGDNFCVIGQSGW